MLKVWIKGWTLMNSSGLNTRHKTKQKGASLVEYVLLTSLIAIICLAWVQTLGERVYYKYLFIADEVGGGTEVGTTSISRGNGGGPGSGGD